MRRFVIMLGLILALLIVVGVYGPRSVTVSAASRLKGPNGYYLALGDSITAGARFNGPTNPHGLANQFFSKLRSHGINHLLNVACAGETSSSFVNGPCPIPQSVPGHFGGNPFSGSQLHAALAFLPCA